MSDPTSVSRYLGWLGPCIEAGWRRHDLDEAAFPEVAAEALRERPPDFGWLEVVDWVHRAHNLPRQTINQHFGEPPVVLYCGQEFYVEALFWEQGSTAIHQHGFAGVFHVLSGSSLACNYDFRVRERRGARVLLGELSLTDTELLRRGDTRPIEAGDALIHAVCHLERPTCTLVVRTYGAGRAGPQYSYFKRGLAYDPFAATDLYVKQSKTLRLLHRLSHARFLDAARAVCADADAYTFVRLLLDVAEYAAPTYRDIAEAGRPRHGALVDDLCACLRDAARDHRLLAMGQKIGTLEASVVFAAMATFSQRAQIFRCVEAYFGLDDARALIGRVMASAERVERSTTMRMLDDTALAVLESAMHTSSLDEALRRLSEQYDLDDAHARTLVTEVHAALGESSMFGVLTRGAV